MLLINRKTQILLRSQEFHRIIVENRFIVKYKISLFYNNFFFNKIKNRFNKLYIKIWLTVKIARYISYQLINQHGTDNNNLIPSEDRGQYHPKGLWRLLKLHIVL